MKTRTKILTAFVTSLAMVSLGSAQTVNPEPGFVQPAEVESNTTYSNQQFNIVIESLSADGDTDHVYFEFPDFLNESLSPNNVDSNISVSSSSTLTDYNGDGVQDTVRVGLSRDGEENTTGNVTLDTGITYPVDFESFEVRVYVEDSVNGNGTTDLEVANAASETDSDSTQNDSDDTEDSTTEPTDDSDSTGNSTDSGETTTNPSDDSTSNNDSTDNSTTESTGNSNSTTSNESTSQDSSETDEDSSSSDSGSTDSSSSDNGTVDQPSSNETGQESNSDEDAEFIASIISLFNNLF